MLNALARRLKFGKAIAAALAGFLGARQPAFQRADFAGQGGAGAKLLQMGGTALFVFAANLIKLGREGGEGALLIGQLVAEFAVFGFGGLHFGLRGLPEIRQDRWRDC